MVCWPPLSNYWGGGGGGGGLAPPLPTPMNVLNSPYFSTEAYNVTQNKEYIYKQEMDGRLACDFKSFSTVFQSYQDNGQMIMKGLGDWIPVYS